MVIRKKIIEVLASLDKAISTIDLAKMTGSEPQTIRHHLETMRSEKMIVKRIERKPRLAFDGAMFGKIKVATWQMRDHV